MIVMLGMSMVDPKVISSSTSSPKVFIDPLLREGVVEPGRGGALPLPLPSVPEDRRKSAADDVGVHAVIRSHKGPLGRYRASRDRSAHILFRSPMGGLHGFLGQL